MSRLLREFVRGEVHTVLRESIPDFATRQVAAGAREDLRRLLLLHINSGVSDPKQQRDQLRAANKVLDDLEDEMKELLDDKLLDFSRLT